MSSVTDFYMPSARKFLLLHTDEDFDRERVRTDKLNTLYSNVFTEDGWVHHVVVSTVRGAEVRYPCKHAMHLDG